MKRIILLIFLLSICVLTYCQDNYSFYKDNTLWIKVQFIDKDSLPLKNYLIKTLGVFYQTDEHGVIEYTSYISTNFPCTDGVNYNDSMKHKRFENIIDHFDADQVYIRGEKEYHFEIDELEILSTGQRRFNTIVKIE